MDKNGIERRRWIVLVPLCTVCHINDDRHCPLETAFETESLKKPMENGMQSMQARFLSSPETFSSYSISSVQVLRSIALDKELLVNY